MQLYYVYIITNNSNTVIYVGITSNSTERIRQHKDNAFTGFSAQYECNKLAYYETYQWVQVTVAREKQLKSGSRQNKIDLINSVNFKWNDLMLQSKSITEFYHCESQSNRT